MIATSSYWESEARRCFELADCSNIEYKMYYIARANTCAQLALAAATLEATAQVTIIGRDDQDIHEILSAPR